MGFRIISNDEVVKAMPTQKEMGKFEQLIRRSPVPIPPVARPMNIVTKVLVKKPVPPPIPEPVQPEPATAIEPEYVPEYMPEYIPEIPQTPQSQPVIKKQVRSAFDLPFNPGNVIDKRRYVPIHIPPAVPEPLVIPATIQKTTERETPEPLATTQPVFPHRPKPVPAPAISPVSIPANIIAERVPIIPERVHEYPDSASIYGRVSGAPASTAPARTEFQNTPVHLPKLNLSYQTGLITTFFIVRIVLGIVMVGFGIYTGGSYYGPNIGKFSGDLSTLFYRYQLGTIIAFAGMIIVYDALRFRIRK